MRSAAELDWVTWDFRAVREPGWRAVYLDLDGLGLSARPLAGWLIQEQDPYAYHRDTDESAMTARPSRRGSAGTLRWHGRN